MCFCLFKKTTCINVNSLTYLFLMMHFHTLLWYSGAFKGCRKVTLGTNQLRVLHFRDILTCGQDGFKKVKLFAIILGFRALFALVIVKILFHLMQQVVLRLSHLAYHLFVFICIKPGYCNKRNAKSKHIKSRHQIRHQWKGDIILSISLLRNSEIA